MSLLPYTVRDWDNFTNGVKVAGSAVLSFLATGFVLSVFLGTPFLAGFWGGLDQFIGWVLLLAAVAYFGYYSDDTSVGFVFTFIAVLFLISSVLPDWLTQPFSFISELLFGTPTLGIDPVTFAVLATASVITFWAVRARLFGRGKRPSTVTNRVRVKSESLAREYAKMFSAIAGFAVTFIAIWSSQTGDVFGEIFTMAADVPVLSAYTASLAGYFGTFLADWPVISRFGQWEFFAIMLALFLIAVGAKYSSALDN